MGRRYVHTIHTVGSLVGTRPSELYVGTWVERNLKSGGTRQDAIERKRLQ